MSLFEDLDIEDFTSNSSSNTYVPNYYHKFNPKKFGFKSLDEHNVKFCRNMFGDVRYFLKKRYSWASTLDEWMFRVINKDNELLYEEKIPDNDIGNRIPRFLRKEVLKDFID